MSMTSQPPKLKRPWYQFSLNTLLILMVVSCVAFAWIGSRMRQARQNRERAAAADETVTAIQKLGAKIVYQYEDHLAQTWLEEQFDDPGAGFLDVHEVYFDGTDVTDAGLERFRGLAQPRILSLAGTKVTDAGLEHLKGLTNLQYLHLWNTRVSDAGLTHLKGLTNLRCLHLGRTKVTDEGVKKLQQVLPNCKILVTDHFEPVPREQRWYEPY